MNDLVKNAVKLPESYCPTCNYQMDTVSSTDGKLRMPSENDISICLNCGQYLAFNANLSVKKATEEDIAKLNKEQQNVLASVKHSIQIRGPIRNEFSPDTTGTEWEQGAFYVLKN